MERQLDLALKTENERVAQVLRFLQPVELASRQVATVALVVGCGELIQVTGQAAVRWSASKGKIASKCREYGLSCSPNTFLKAAAELEKRRVLGVLRNTKPWTYVVRLGALAELEPAPKAAAQGLADLACFRPGPVPDQGGDRSGPVRSGQAARVRESIETQNPCPTVYRVPVDVLACEAGLIDRLRRPWDRKSGLTDADLVRAVQSGDMQPVRALWQEARVLEWVGCKGEASDDEALRFLTIVHHCATSPGINQSRFGVLVSRVRRNLDVTRIPQASERWAAGVLSARNRTEEKKGAGR